MPLRQRSGSESWSVSVRDARSRLFSLLLTIRVVGLLMAALAIWVFAQIADEVVEKDTQTIDTLILQKIKLGHTPLLDQIMVGVTFVGQPSVLVVMTLGIGIWLLIKRRRTEVTTLAIAGLGAVGLNYWLKLLFARERPVLWERVVGVHYYSFPSGHAMVSIVIYGLIGYLLAIHFRRWRVLIFSLTIILVVAIGVSRLYLGVHWPTDVAAGYAAGLVWLIACILSLEIWRNRFNRSRLKKDSASSGE
jgi:undecaprenyl-diphosphatase